VGLLEGLSIDPNSGLISSAIHSPAGRAYSVMASDR